MQHPFMKFGLGYVCPLSCHFYCTNENCKYCVVRQRKKLLHKHVDLIVTVFEENPETSFQERARRDIEVNERHPRKMRRKSH